jgi:hypothetical protein
LGKTSLNALYRSRQDKQIDEGNQVSPSSSRNSSADCSAPSHPTPMWPVPPRTTPDTRPTSPSPAWIPTTISKSRPSQSHATTFGLPLPNADHFSLLSSSGGGIFRVQSQRDREAGVGLGCGEHYNIDAKREKTCDGGRRVVKRVGNGDIRDSNESLGWADAVVGVRGEPVVVGEPSGGEAGELAVAADEEVHAVDKEQGKLYFGY